MAEVVKDYNIARTMKVVEDAIILEMDEVHDGIEAAAAYNRKNEVVDRSTYLVELKGMLTVITYLTEKMPGYEGGHNVAADRVEEIVVRGRKRFAKALQILDNRTSLGEGTSD